MQNPTCNIQSSTEQHYDSLNLLRTQSLILFISSEHANLKALCEQATTTIYDPQWWFNIRSEAGYQHPPKWNWNISGLYTNTEAVLLIQKSWHNYCSHSKKQTMTTQSWHKADQNWSLEEKQYINTTKWGNSEGCSKVKAMWAKVTLGLFCVPRCRHYYSSTLIFGPTNKD